MNITSRIGRAPTAAAPIARPIMLSSAIGMSRTRSGPKRSYSPSVARYTPP